MRSLVLIGLSLAVCVSWIGVAEAQVSLPFQIAGEIRSASPTGLAIQQLSPNDPLFSRQLNLSRLRVPAAWSRTTGTQSVIAVIDTGLDLSQEDLKNRLWVNTDEIAGNGIDDDNNGYIDDIHGVNTIDQDANIKDDHGHGTGIASIIAASSNNGLGISGINWNAKIMVIKALNSTGGGDFSDVVRAIRYAVDNGARVINMSFGSHENVSSLRSAVNYALEKNVLIVAAVGNKGVNSIFYPAAYSGVLAVGSVNQSNRISSFSNYGEGVDVVAPGEGVPMADLGARKYSEGYGTSFAAAEISGIASLVLSISPSANYRTIAETLIETADQIGNNPDSPFYGAGIVNAEAAVNFKPVVLTGSVTTVGTPRATGIDLATLTLTVSDGTTPQVGIPISVSISGSGNIVNDSQILAEGETLNLGVTNAFGQVSLRLASTLAEAKTVTFTAAGGSSLTTRATVQFTAPAGPAYQAAWVSQSPYLTMAVGETKTLSLTLRNVGQAAWIDADQINRGQFRLGTDRLKDRDSTFYSSNWLSTNRVTGLGQAVVKPGDIVTLNFPVTASAPGQYREYFGAVAEGVTWFNDLGIYWDITVGGGQPVSSVSAATLAYDAELTTRSNSVTLSPGQTGSLSVSLKNIGNATWQPVSANAGDGEVKLGTTTPRDRASGFYNSSWLSPNRVLGSDFAVAPGGSLALTFSATAPAAKGTYTEDFQLVSEFVTWFGPMIRFLIHVV